MVPGVNGNALAGEIPQTRSQAGIVTPADATNAPPAVAKPGPANTALLCNGCSSKTNTINNLTSENVKLVERIDAGVAELAAMVIRLDAASGVTVNTRQGETIKRLQGLEEVQRHANDILEWENGILRNLCAKAKIDVEAELTQAKVKK